MRSAEAQSDKAVILVVEDEYLLRTDASAFLTEAGYQVLAVSTPAHAIKILESRSDVRVVFTDINLGASIDGIELAQMVSTRWPPIKLIVTSGHLTPLKATQLPPGSEFISKPYEPQRITLAVRNMISAAH